jgi:hypothetical protein
MTQATAAAIHGGNPDVATTPAATLQTAKTDPDETSICPVRITRVIPTETINTGRFVRNTSIRFSALKYAGAAKDKTMANTPMAIRTDISRLDKAPS